MRKYLTSVELGRRWGYSRNTVTGWCRDGLLKGAKKLACGNLWSIPIEVVADAEHVDWSVLASEYATHTVDKSGEL